MREMKWATPALAHHKVRKPLTTFKYRVVPHLNSSQVRRRWIFQMTSELHVPSLCRRNHPFKEVLCALVNSFAAEMTQGRQTIASLICRRVFGWRDVYTWIEGRLTTACTATKETEMMIYILLANAKSGSVTYRHVHMCPPCAGCHLHDLRSDGNCNSIL